MSEVRDLDLMYDIKILFDKKVIVYGAGNNGKKALDLLRETGIVKEIFLCDSNSKKWGNYIDHQEIVSFSGLVDKIDSDFAVIISVENKQWQDEIIETIQSYLGIDISMYTLFALKQSIMFNVYNIPESEYKSQKIREREISHKVLEMGYIKERYKHQLNMLKHFTFSVYDSEIYLIIQPAKVGSSSILESYRLYGKRALHIHRIDNVEYNKGDFLNYSRHTKIKIISLVREPVARQISLLFQWIGMDVYSLAGTLELGRNFDLEKMIQYFMGIHEDLDEFMWFDQQIKKVFGINIFENPFDKKKGFSIIENGNIEILLMKMEKLNDLEDIIGKFANINNFHLINSNEGKDKEYRYAYKQFLEEYKVPQSFIDYYYKDNPAMDYFYTKEEQKNFLKKWERKESV